MTSPPLALVSRRTILAGLGVGMLAAHPRTTEAQDATPDTATPAAGQTASINGAELYYEVRGPADGPPVMLMHGGLGSIEEWSNLSPDLETAGYRVVLMECRARGRSTWGDLPITYEQMAADALGMLDHLGLDKVDYVGWSDGGIIGLELAVEHPERLNRAVIFGANYTPEGALTEPIVSDQMPPFEELIATYQRLSPEPERLEELLEVLGILYQTAPNFTEEELGSISIPILILDGAEEELVRADQPVRMAEMIPGAELVIMPDTGHFAPIAVPEEFNRIVLAFLAGEQVGTPVATPEAATAAA